MITQIIDKESLKNIYMSRLIADFKILNYVGLVLNAV